MACIRFRSDFFKGHNSRKGDNSDKKKNTGQLFFHEESIYEISKRQRAQFSMNGRMDNPKPICSRNFFEVGGITRLRFCQLCTPTEGECGILSDPVGVGMTLSCFHDIS